MESWLHWSNGALAIKTDWPRDKMQQSIERGYRFLLEQQATDGSWAPLWFGNQDAPHEENRVYGTGRVVLTLCLHGDRDGMRIAARDRGIKYLLDCQRADGSWGGGASVCYEPGESDGGNGTIEETAVALQALIAYRYPGDGASAVSHPLHRCVPIDQAVDRAIGTGMVWLCRAVERRWPAISSPIGFYFAKLWYHEQLYPWVFSAAALKGYLIGRSAFGDRHRNEKTTSGVTQQGWHR
jgi:squalene-hopene/tetraprenyl-beta-curcumene cyclase